MTRADQGLSLSGAIAIFCPVLVLVIGWLAMNLTSAAFRTRIGLRGAFYDDAKVIGFPGRIICEIY